MDLFDLPKARRQRREGKTLYERAHKYIGAVKTPPKPKNTAARAKTLARGIATAKHPR
jgi:hypothetical protein